MRRGYIAGLGAIALAGCGDPASEAPVAMQPGAYEVQLAGAMFGFRTRSEPDRTRCINNSPEHIPTALLRPYVALHEDCAPAKFERTGNRLTGSSVCRLDPKDDNVSGTATVRFEGTVFADKLEGTMKLDLDLEDTGDSEAKTAALLLKAASIPITATRTGDCTGDSGNEPRLLDSSRSGPDSDTSEPELLESEISE